MKRSPKCVAVVCLSPPRPAPPPRRLDSEEKTAAHSFVATSAPSQLFHSFSQNPIGATHPLLSSPYIYYAFFAGRWQRRCVIPLIVLLQKRIYLFIIHNIHNMHIHIQ